MVQPVIALLGVDRLAANLAELTQHLILGAGSGGHFTPGFVYIMISQGLLVLLAQFLAALSANFLSIALFSAGGLNSLDGGNMVGVGGLRDDFGSHHLAANLADFSYLVTIFGAVGGFAFFVIISGHGTSYMLASGRNGNSVFGLATGALTGALAISSAARLGVNSDSAPSMTQRSSASFSSFLAAASALVGYYFSFSAGSSLVVLSITYPGVGMRRVGRRSRRKTGDRNRDQQSRNHEYAKKFLHVRCSSRQICLVII